VGVVITVVMDGGSFKSTVLCTTATILTAASPLLKRISQVDGDYLYNVNMVYFWAEVLKLIIATVLFLAGIGGTGDFRAALCSGPVQRRFSLTAFLFFVQNNLGFVVLLYFSAASFQLLMNLRIVAVALFSIPLLHKAPTAIQWCCILLLCIGGTQHFLSVIDEPLSNTSMVGLLAMLSVVATSALANVYNQFSLQQHADQPLMLQNMFLYAYGVFFNGLNWARSIYIDENAPLPAYGEITSSVVLLIVFTAIYGLTISAVLKSLGAMVRSILGVLAIAVTAFGEYLFFGTVPSLFTDTTFLVIIISAQAYSSAPPAGK
jgi:hypothetical protein